MLKPQFRSILMLFALTGAVFTLPACSIFTKAEKEVPDEPADKLYNEGLALQHRKEWKKAGDKFTEIDRIYSHTDWGRKALLLAAYSYYENKSFEEAITAGRRFLTLYPSSPDAAYAQYIVGSAYYDEIPDVTRDQARTEKALLTLLEIERRWPQSDYAKAARRKVEAARDNLAGREMSIGRYYLNQRNYIGAVNRFRVVVSQYQTTRHVEEALARLAECYLAMGIVNEAQTAAAILGHNFPDSQWYADTYKLITSKGLEAREDKGSWISQSFKKLVGQ
jgi:outer membrane protein assembly factor BamD